MNNWKICQCVKKGLQFNGARTLQCSPGYIALLAASLPSNNNVLPAYLFGHKNTASQRRTEVLQFKILCIVKVTATFPNVW